MVPAATAISSANVVDLDPFSPEFLSDPYCRHAAIREAGPVVYLPKYQLYASARYAEVMEALRAHDVYCSGYGVGLSDFSKEPPWRPPSLLLETDPPEHDRARKIMNQVVSHEAVKSLSRAWREQASELVAALVNQGRFDAVTELAEVFPLRVFPDVIGVQSAGRENLLPYAAAVFNAFGPRNEIFERTNREAAPAMAWVAAACRRENLLPGGWGRSVFDAVDRSECTELEAERLVRSLLSAGIDTTVNGIGNLLYAFATHPDQWARLREQPSLAKRALEEAMRWVSTVQTFFRTTTRDTELGDVPIPKGAKVLLFLAAANRDPRRFPDPDAFDIGRQAGSHVAFGYGVHRCLGQMVARLEMEAILDALRERVVTLKLCATPGRRLNNTLFSFSHLPLEVLGS